MHIPNISWLCENCPEWRKRRVVIESDEDDWLLSYFLSTSQLQTLTFTSHWLDPYFVINKVLFDRQKTLSRIFESAITFVRFHYKAFLFKLTLDDFAFKKFVFWTCGSLLFSELPASSRIRHGGSPLSASHRKYILLWETIKTECHIINNSPTNQLAQTVLGNIDPRSSRSVRTATTSGQYSPVRPSRSVLVSG